MYTLGEPVRGRQLRAYHRISNFKVIRISEIYNFEAFTRLLNYKSTLCFLRLVETYPNFLGAMNSYPHICRISFYLLQDALCGRLRRGLLTLLLSVFYIADNKKTTVLTDGFRKRIFGWFSLAWAQKSPASRSGAVVYSAPKRMSCFVSSFICLSSSEVSGSTYSMPYSLPSICS